MRLFQPFRRELEQNRPEPLNEAVPGSVQVRIAKRDQTITFAGPSDWSHGSGTLVEGPTLSLPPAMTGRRAGYDDLSGDGVAQLRSS